MAATRSVWEDVPSAIAVSAVLFCAFLLILLGIHTACCRKKDTLYIQNRPSRFRQIFKRSMRTPTEPQSVVQYPPENPVSMMYNFPQISRVPVYQQQPPYPVETIPRQATIPPPLVLSPPVVNANIYTEPLSLRTSVCV